MYWITTKVSRQEARRIESCVVCVCVCFFIVVAKDFVAIFSMTPSVMATSTIEKKMGETKEHKLLCIFAILNCLLFFKTEAIPAPLHRYTQFYHTLFLSAFPLNQRTHNAPSHYRKYMQVHEFSTYKRFHCQCTTIKERTHRHRHVTFFFFLWKKICTQTSNKQDLDADTFLNVSQAFHFTNLH